MEGACAGADGAAAVPCLPAQPHLQVLHAALHVQEERVGARHVLHVDRRRLAALRHQRRGADQLDGVPARAAGKGGRDERVWQGISAWQGINEGARR